MISFGYPQQLKPIGIALEISLGEIICSQLGNGSSAANSLQGIP